jgi:hypothetical protein
VKRLPVRPALGLSTLEEGRGYVFCWAGKVPDNKNFIEKIHSLGRGTLDLILAHTYTYPGRGLEKQAG